MVNMYKCLELIFPGRFTASGFIILAVVFMVLPLKAQQSTAKIPFRQSSHLLWDNINPDITRLDIMKEQEVTFERKSPSRAFLYSLLLPGTGEAYVGETIQSKVFLGIELVSWGLVVANMINVHLREGDYKNYAVEHASVMRTGKNDQYWIDIGKYDTIYEFNEQRRRERNIDAIYEENNYYFWNWDQRENRLNYDAKRIETREIERNRVYFFAAIALNHLVSAINALRLANSHNRQIEELSINLNFNYHPYHQRFLLSFQKSF